MIGARRAATPTQHRRARQRSPATARIGVMAITQAQTYAAAIGALISPKTSDALPRDQRPTRLQSKVRSRDRTAAAIAVLDSGTLISSRSCDNIPDAGRCYQL